MILLGALGPRTLELQSICSHLVSIYFHRLSNLDIHDQRWLPGCWCKACHIWMPGHAKATIVACGLDLQCIGSYACATWNTHCMNICVADRVVATWLKLHGTSTGSCMRRCTTSGAIAYRNTITCSTLIFLQLPPHLAWPSRLYIGYFGISIGWMLWVVQ